MAMANGQAAKCWRLLGACRTVITDAVQRGSLHTLQPTCHAVSLVPSPPAQPIGVQLASGERSYRAACCPSEPPACSPAVGLRVGFFHHPLQCAAGVARGFSADADAAQPAAADAAAQRPPAGEERNEHRVVSAAPRRQQYPVRVANLARNVLKSDIVEFFAHCNVVEDNVRAEYGLGLNYLASWVAFPTEEDRNRALLLNGYYLGTRRVSLQSRNTMEWMVATVHRLAVHSRGRYVLLLNLPELSTNEDVRRYFHGFSLLGNPVTYLSDSNMPNLDAQRFKPGERRHRAVVRFTTPEEAQRAIRQRHRGYIGSSQIRLRLLA